MVQLVGDGLYRRLSRDQARVAQGEHDPAVGGPHNACGVEVRVQGAADEPVDFFWKVGIMADIEHPHVDAVSLGCFHSLVDGDPARPTRADLGKRPDCSL